MVNEPERLPTTSECGHHLLQIVKGRKQGIGVAAEGASWRTADPSRYPQQVCRGLVQLLLRKQVDSEEAQWLAKQIGSRLPPGWGATWTERGFGELTGTRTDQQPLVVDSLHSLRQKGEGPGAPSTVTSNVKFINLHLPRQCDTVGAVKSVSGRVPGVQYHTQPEDRITRKGAS